MFNPITIILTHKINFTNLLIAQITKNSNNLYYPCTYILENNKFFTITKLDKLVSDISDDAHFRNVAWHNHLKYLENCYADAQKSNQKIVFGCHLIDEIIAVKKHFGSDCLTVSLNYQESLYHYILKNVAEYHVFLLQNNRIPKNDVDHYYLNSPDPEKIYTKQFQDMNLFPINSVNNLDYNINLNDFFNYEQFSSHLDFLQFSFNPSTESFYNTWLQSTV